MMKYGLSYINIHLHVLNAFAAIIKVLYENTDNI